MASLGDVLDKHLVEYESQLLATRDGQERLLAALTRLQHELGHARQLQPSAEVVHASAKLVKLRERVLALGLKSTELERRVASMQAQLRRARQALQQPAAA